VATNNSWNSSNPAAVSDGGTGSTAFTAGSVVFSNGTILTQDNASLFFDDTNNRLGIGTTTPGDTLHVVGAMELDHTAAENDDHALEIVCDANGFTDVKALDINYTTGALAAGEDEEAILVNIDESASTGGIVAGYLVLSTAEGSATVNGYETGINVNPIVHESGTFGDADSILNKAVDVTAALASGGAGAISIFVADNDTLTIGDAAPWGEHEIILATGASGAGIAPTFEYSTGGAAFSAFSPADGTNGFRNSGAILWDASSLAGWATATSGLYEIKITRTRNSLSTTPIIDELQIAALTEYKWDKDGNVNLNSLTLATDLAVAEGGTGASTLTGVLTGNGTGAITGAAVTQYGVLVGGASNAVDSTAVGTSGQVLTSNGAGVAPTFQAGGLTSPVAVTDGGTGLTTITDHSILLGSGTSAVTPTAAPGDGQLLVGAASADPNLMTAWMQQGNNCFFWNLSFTHSAGTLTLAGSDGTALSATAPGYVVMPSNATQGRMVLHKIVANDTLTVSDLTGNLFGTTTAIAWADELPLYIGFMADSSDANLEPIIMRIPHAKVSPASSANIGDPSSATADLQSSLFAWNDITEGNYQSMQIGLIGSLTATKAVTTNAWTLDALTDNDGAGRWNDNRVFAVPAGHNGAGAGKWFVQSSGTAPGFSSSVAKYRLSRDGKIQVQCAFATVNVAGVGAVVLEFASPLKRNADYNNISGAAWYYDSSAAVNRTGANYSRGDNDLVAMTIIGISTATIQQQNIDTSDQLYFTYEQLVTTTE